MQPYILPLHQIDRTKSSLAGGKAANLGECTKIPGIHVPAGFCITTEAYKNATENNPELHSLLDELAEVKAADSQTITTLSAKLRTTIENIPIPADITTAITRRLKEDQAYAIRSSATAEDLPTASFAGQQDSFLNIVGKPSILQHIPKCWASLFTERAVTYRIQNGFDHRQVNLAVIIQQMVPAQVSGVLFTADPVTGHRKKVSIEAVAGLGESLVSGRSSPEANLLTTAQLEKLTHIGRTIEAHFNSPQDIEWCLAGDEFYIVQSRPITTLYPIPKTPDNDNHVYVSVGHQQMFTDAMKPLGISLWQQSAGHPMHVAGGRLFVDVTPELSSPVKSDMLINVLGKSDPLIRDALITIQHRQDFIKLIPDTAAPPRNFQTLQDYDPSVVEDLIKKSQTAIAELKQNIQTHSGVELIDFIIADNQRAKQAQADPQSFGVIMTGFNAAAWLNEKMQEWLGENNVADTLSQSVPHNITSEMGLELLNLADTIRPYPEVIEFLQHTTANDFLNQLKKIPGGAQAHEAIQAWLDKYGMRCAGEIDITRPRWSETPLTIIPMLLNNIRNFEPGAAQRKFEHGRQQAVKKEHELLARVKQLPDGEQKAKETKRMILLVRNLIGYREYPKYAIVSRYFIYKQALLRLIPNQQDIFYLTLEELRESIRTNTTSSQLIAKRKAEFKWNEKLTPPRVITSDGEIITGSYHRNSPANSIIGLPVSAGIAEGRARVILDIKDADLEPGDILITKFTDPSWTPLFVSIKALVTEVGGRTTHGAVIAREYGLPAVVGVENATQLIKDGQQIRVNGTDGCIEFL